jgi:high-affinity nickel permease
VTGFSALLVGLGLGLRHALDADHVVVVSTMLQREPGFWRAARIAALWGAGHSVAFLTVGLMIVVVGLRVPEVFEQGAQLLVAVMLVALGLWHLTRVRRPDPSDDAEPVEHSPAARPIAIGLVHGLAGSAGIALLAATTIESRAVAVGYLFLVAIGTVVGMVTLTALLARPIRWTVHREGWLKRAVTILAALLSIGLGVSIFADTFPGAP